MIKMPLLTNTTEQVAFAAAEACHTVPVNGVYLLYILGNTPEGAIIQSEYIKRGEIEALKYWLYHNRLAPSDLMDILSKLDITIDMVHKITTPTRG